MNLPNQLTVGRVVLALLGALLLSLPVFPFQMSIATAVFVVAAITDRIDGKIARRRGLISDFGAYMDSLADKLLVMLYFIALHSFGVYALWLVVAMIARDLLNDGIRSYLVSHGVVMSANRFSKWKAMLQMLSITVALLPFCVDELRLVDVLPVDAVTRSAEVIMMVALAFGIVGTAQYLRAHGSVLFRDT